MRIISVPTNWNKIVQCNDASKHKIFVKDFGLREFYADDREFSFWLRIPGDRRNALRDRHFNSGECLLCTIDDMMKKE